MATVMAMAHSTRQLDAANPRLLLIEDRLGEPLAEFITARRVERTSWRRIANVIYDRTKVDISGEALRAWYVALPATETGPVTGDKPPPTGPGRGTS